MFNKICHRDSIQYTIQAGDTLWRLSQTYGVSVQSILDQNPGIDPQNLQIGSTICIPRARTALTLPDMTDRPVTCPEGDFTYTIQAGDTLWRLSQTYGVSVQSILDQNPGIDPQNLQIGSTICIPRARTALTLPDMTDRPVTCPEGDFTYTIQAGDTLWRLSQTYGVSVQSILDHNPGIDPWNLQIGTTLCVPLVSKVPVPPTAQIMPKVPVLPTAPIMPEVLVPPEAPIMPRVPVPPTAPIMPEVLVPPEAPIMPRVPIPPTAPIMPEVLVPPEVPIMPRVPVPPTAPIMPWVSIPKTAPTAPECPSKFTYCIKKCDSICTIARKFHVSVKSILRVNPGIDPRCLCAGTYIYVPSNCCARDTCRYAVMAGDTLNSIANKFSVSPSALVEANPNIDFNCLVKCQFVCIP